MLHESTAKMEDDELMIIDENAGPDAKKRERPDLSSDAETPAKKRKTEKEDKTAEKERKRQERELQQQQRKEQKEREQAEKERKKQEREEAKRLKDEEKQKKEEEKQKKKAETDQKKREAEAERAKKKAQVEAEKQKREDEREQKRREKERIEEEKQKAIEKKEAAIRRQSDLLKSFIKKVKPETPETWGWHNERFHPFEIKGNMEIAPHLRRPALTKDEKAKMMTVQLEKSDYLERALKMKPNCSKNPMRAKLFQFQDSYRPPYYGTFRKTSKVITGRRPFATSPEEVAYDVDSEAEWEDNQEPENADECISDNDEPIKEDEVLQDEFYVGHGYLSDSEGSEDGGQTGEDVDKRKRRFGRRSGEFTKQRSNKNRRSRKHLKVNIFGISWAEPEEKLAKKLHKRLKSAVMFDFSQLRI